MLNDVNFNGQNFELNKQLNDDVEECYNDLFKSTLNIDLINQNNRNQPKKSINEDFNLDKELAHSKVNININENIQDKFLVNRIWDCTNDNKINILEQKVENVFKELDKKKINSLINQIKNINLEQRFYYNFDPIVNKTGIGAVSGLDFLVENTFFCQEKYHQLMISDREYLKPYLYKYRNVLGDGDCFYRGLIFSLMENIILTNNLMQMKELLILYHEKINLNNRLVEEKDYLKTIKFMNISIVSQIMYILINQMENDISEAYKSLLKIFLYCPDFDFGIIFFTRYLIYEYIKENEDKIYSREYQVEVGCLLPEDYVIDKGDKNEYCYENFYSLQLLNPKTFAEKIVIYITPFVFNLKMNILMYDYGINGAQSVIQEKPFLNNNNNSDIEINLLFRKMHYDIYYKQKYFEKYEESFNILKNNKEIIRIINKIPEKQLEEKVSKQTNKIKENKDNNNKKEFEDINKVDNFDLANDFNYLDLDKNNSPKCLECKKPYTNAENPFCLCDNCLLNNLKTALLSAFFEFIKSDNYINCKQKLTQFLLQKTCTISEVQENISILSAINNSKFKFDDIFIEIRKGLCLYCGDNINNDKFYLRLPCECRICSEKCFINYIEHIKRYVTLKSYESDHPEFYYLNHLEYLECFCGFFYHTNDVIYMINEMEQKKLKDIKKFYQTYIENIWNWKCMLCRKSFRINNKFFRLYFKTEAIDKKIIKTEFKHLLCEECVVNNHIKEKNTKKILCFYCEMEHEITKLNEVNEENEDSGDCLIF